MDRQVLHHRFLFADLPRSKIRRLYQRELAIFDYEPQNKSYEELVTEFKASTKKVRRAVFIEVAAVLDSEETEEETTEEEVTEWLNKLGEEFGFRESEIKKMIRWTEDFNDLVGEAFDYINKR